MKATTFNKRALTLGIITALGVASPAIAAEIKDSAGKDITITNVASATYNVGGITQKPVESNPVVVNITESAAFTLIATNNDDIQNDDFNDKQAVTPNGNVVFVHELANTGNVEDSYSLSLAQNGVTPSFSTDKKDYDLDNSTVTIQVKDIDGNITQTLTPTVAELNAPDYAIALAPGEKAIITITAKTTGNVGGDTQNLTLTATSEYFDTNGVADAEDTLTNVDNSITELPVFKIIKSLTNNLNLNDPSDIASYTIKVTNDDTTGYAADATNITIIDNLPKGLKLVGTPTVSGGNGTPPVVTVTNDGAGTSSANDGFIITGANLAVNETITVTFDVQKDENEALAASTVNHATVEDDLDDDPNTNNTVIDSTDPNSPTQNTDDYYPTDDDSEVTDGSTPTIPGGDSTQPLVTIERGLNLSNPTIEEVPNTSDDTTKATHSTIITNTGEEVEGDVANELTFTITDSGTNPAVNPENGTDDTVYNKPVDVVYDADGDSTTTNDQTTVTITPDSNGVYDINDAFANIPGSEGMAPNSTITINYDVTSEDAVTGTEETTVVELIPSGEGAPTTGNFVVTDTTQVKGLELIKAQALDANCDGKADSAFSSSATPLPAKPSECIIYQITATSGFTDLAITNLLISDATSQFANKAVYNDDGSISVTNAESVATNPVTLGIPNSTIGNAVYTTVNRLAGKDVATLQFSITINP